MNKFGLLLRSKHKLLDIWSFFLGNYRFGFPKLVRKHIKEQISFRIKCMKKECIMNGSCLECGCDIPQLAYCDKACEGDCYPPMMNKKEWYNWKENGFFIDHEGFIWSHDIPLDGIFKITKTSYL